MTLHEHESKTQEADESPPGEDHGGHRGHSRWMMIACCVPMLAIAVAIAATGAGFGFLLIAGMCTAMMAMMMGGTSHGGGSGKGQR